MDVSQETKDRIVAAAEALYEEAKRAEFPTVASVRARANVDMNAASTTMREWRRAKTTKATPVVVDVPDKVKATSLAALSTLWAEAQALANLALESAQAGWEGERAEAETLREQLSAAFDAKEAEVAKAMTSIETLETSVKSADAELSAAAANLANANERATTAQARTVEIERRADGLSEELARVHAEAKIEREKVTAQTLQAQTELKAERERAAEQALQMQAALKTERERHTADLAAMRAELEGVRTELATVKARAEAEAANHTGQQKQHLDEANRVADRLKALEIDLATARQALASAREDAATLRGELKVFASLQTEITRLAMTGKAVQEDGKPK